MNVLLTILDGWGINKKDPYEEGDAITLAKPYFFNYLKKTYSFTELEASGLAVGLPPKQIGSSEVGHLNLGAGRIVKQEILRINNDIVKKRFCNKISALKKYKRIHLIGLLSRGGIHSSLNHLLAIMDCLKDHSSVFIHAILDGRDVNPKSASIFLNEIEKKLKPGWKIVDLIGRYYAMDRDKHFERTAKAYNLYVYSEGKHYLNWQDALRKEYSLKNTDEFFPPVVLEKEPILENDAVFFFNFRPDRARQIIQAFNGENGFKKLNIFLLTMLPYYKEYRGNVVYKKELLKNTLGEVISDLGFRQLRIAESEKYAHVTYFFSGEREMPFNKEKRIIIPSPRIATYDLKPEMSAKEITDRLLKEIKQNNYKLVVQNYANTDMVGHTGNLKATIKAVKTVDKCLEKIYDNLDLNKWYWIITADHGNADKLYDNGKPYTAHTLNPVPFIIVSKEKYILRKGVLGNVAPTILDLLKIKRPKEMIDSLVVKNASKI